MICVKYHCPNCGEYHLFEELDICPNCFSHFISTVPTELSHDTSQKVTYLLDQMSKEIKEVVLIKYSENAVFPWHIIYLGKQSHSGYFSEKNIGLSIMIGLGFSGTEERVLFREEGFEQNLSLLISKDNSLHGKS